MVQDVSLILLGGGFLAAVALALLLLRAPAALRIYAHPNARSSHRAPTPTGGGIVFVMPVIAYLGWLAGQGAGTAGVLAAAGAVLAVVGLVDDRREVAPAVRLAIQLLVVAAVAWTLLAPEEGIRGSALPSEEWPWLIAWVLLPVTALALAWQVNVYNFMDGIDGLAAAQALVFAVGAHVAGGGLPGWSGDLLWLVAGSVLGFLVVNWPPARLFMGDVGSYFLGLLTGAVAILLWREHTLALAASLILLSGFWFDASYTLIVRVATRQAFTQPHRTHLYQKVAARRGHLWTTGCYLIFATSWLLPLSWLCVRFPASSASQSLLWLVPAVLPLALASWRFRAGLPERGHVHE